MPEFKTMVRERLPKLRLDAEQDEQVIAELAGYLEDSADDGEDSHAELESTDWARLGADIRSAKEVILDRMKQVVVPGTVALVVSGIEQLGCHFLGLHTYVFPTSTTAFCFQWPWLAALPLAGAAGAYAARRAGAGVGGRIAASLFPALLLAPLMLLIAVVEIIFRAVNGSLAAFPWFAIVGYFVSWTFVPAIPLLAGAAFFLSGHSGTSEAEPRAMAHSTAS